MKTIDFESQAAPDDEGWVEFIVEHSGGAHTLQMLYASRRPNPCLVRIGGAEMHCPVAFGTTVDCDRGASVGGGARWFDDEGSFDLGADSPVRVGFRPLAAGADFPSIRAFRFIPHPKHAQQRSGVGVGDFGNSERRIDVSDCSRSSRRFRSAPTAVTFTFEIGVSSERMAQEEDVEYVETYLGGKAIKFIFGEAHDTMSIDGDPIGDQHGGDNFPKVTFVDPDDVISSVALGLSSYKGEGLAAFSALVLEAKSSSSRASSAKRPLVGAKLVEPIYCYDRRKLGLNLWLTSICAPKNRPVSRYGFTLSSDVGLDFCPDEFESFWDWLVRIKHMMVSVDGDQSHSSTNVDVDSVRLKMQSLHDFLRASFSGGVERPTCNAASSEGVLYGSCRHVSITYDAFSIFIYRLPNGNEFRSTLFVDGKQYDTKRSRMEELKLARNDVIAFAISNALKDTDLLFQMGLVRVSPGDSKGEDEIELLRLRDSGEPFTGTYDNTVMARRVVTLLAMAGLRRVSYETVMDEPEGWDIYDVAAGARAAGVYAPKRNAMFELGAAVCAVIQVLVPAFLIYRGVVEDLQDLTWDVYLARLFFAVYAIAYEAKTWDVDNGDRVTGWLCFLPEFDTRRLIVGMLMNKVCQVVISVAIVVLMLRSFTVADVTLNALALYFVLEVDDNLVEDRTLEDLLIFQREELVVLKSKTALEYRLQSFTEEDLPKLQDLPARYFRVASHRISTATIAFLILGSVWMIVEPWVLGWKVSHG